MAFKLTACSTHRARCADRMLGKWYVAYVLEVTDAPKHSVQRLGESDETESEISATSLRFAL
jgi:hypothetical protein